MLTPNQLYYQYTKNPCSNGGTDFQGNPIGSVGAGTPYDLTRLSNFLKQLKYPCYSKSKYSQQPFTDKIQEETSEDNPEDYKGILNSGKYRLALPYRILSKIDVEAFSEIQPDIMSGTSMAIRNACDIARACYIEQDKNKPYEQWEHRMAYEYLYTLGSNSITDCLMMLGPDLVSAEEAIERGTGCGDLDCLPRFSSKIEGSALGASFQCAKNAQTGAVECTPCSECQDDPEDFQENTCCSAGSCSEKIRFCCGDITGERDGVWRFEGIAPGYAGRGYPVVDSDDLPLKHGGILKRKSYDGFINLLNNSGSNLYSCPIDLLLWYIQKHNNYNYNNNTTYNENQTDTPIDRIRTISLIYSDSSSEMMDWIKDLIYNGYGVVIMTNVGFPNKRDSTGLSFPDRIFYHSYAIVGYDDRRTDYEECVFLLANSWGEWNKGGQPNWGPIPKGSFLVTQSHLECMLNLYRTDQIGCRAKTKPSNLPPGLDWMYDACTEDTSCTPWECTDKQKSLGMAFALSLTDGFPRQVLDYTQFYRTSHNSSSANAEFSFRPGTS